MVLQTRVERSDAGIHFFYSRFTEYMLFTYKVVYLFLELPKNDFLEFVGLGRGAYFSVSESNL